ncbi:hypothetical protein JCM12294_09330 [Desulfocicer niacini]
MNMFEEIKNQNLVVNYTETGMERLAVEVFRVKTGFVFLMLVGVKILVAIPCIWLREKLSGPKTIGKLMRRGTDL